MIQILAAQNMDLQGGYFQINNQEYTVRFNGEFDDLQSMRDLQIPTMYGPKKLSQFAEVVDSGKDIRQRSVYFNVKRINEKKIPTFPLQVGTTVIPDSREEIFSLSYTRRL